MNRFIRSAIAGGFWLLGGLCFANGDSTSTTLRELERNAQEFKAAYNAGDVERLAAMYTEDAIYVSPHVPNLHISGRETIRKNWQRGAAMGGHIDSVEVIKGDASNDVAYIVTKYAATNNGIRAEGRNVLILKRIDGVWRIVVHASVVGD